MYGLLKKKGFTLIELLIVISIIAILSVIGIAAYGNVQNKAQDTRRKGDVEAIAKALEQHYDAVNFKYKPLPETSDEQKTWFADGVPKTPENTDYSVCFSPDATSMRAFNVCATLADGTTKYCKRSIYGDLTIDCDGTVASNPTGDGDGGTGGTGGIVGRPTVTTSDATLNPNKWAIATLKSTVNPGGADSATWYKWGPAGGSCSSLSNSTAVVSLTASTSDVNNAQTICQLAASTPYSFCAAIRNSYGTFYGDVKNFNTIPAPTAAGVFPSGRTLPFSSCTCNAADFNDNMAVDSTDFSRLGVCNNKSCSYVAAFGSCAPVDANGDGTVNTPDYDCLSYWYGWQCPLSDYKRVFITNGVYNGNMGGFGGADTVCRNEARQSRLAGDWKAWLSDSATSVSSRFTHSTKQYKLLNGITVVANDWADLTTQKSDGSYLRHPIDRTPYNILSDSVKVWTNTEPDGSTSSNDISIICNNWTDQGSSVSGNEGVYQNIDASWTRSTNSPCSESKHLYCFEQ